MRQMEVFGVTSCQTHEPLLIDLSDMTRQKDNYLRCSKCRCVLYRSKRRWFEKLALVGAAFACRWCGRRKYVSLVTILLGKGPLSEDFDAELDSSSPVQTG